MSVGTYLWCTLESKFVFLSMCVCGDGCVCEYGLPFVVMLSLLSMLLLSQLSICDPQVPDGGSLIDLR